MNRAGKVLRIVAIILLGLTAAMNLLGGIGTTCAAFSDKVEYKMAFKEILDYRWLYQVFVVTAILIGIVGVWATIRLVRGGPTVYRDALIVLAVGTLLAGVHYFTSMALRGKAAPANVKFYLNALTLVVFLLFRAPGIRDRVDFLKPGGKSAAASASGMAAILSGILMLTIFTWAGPSHTFFGENWVEVLQTPLNIGGAFLVMGGLVTLVKVALDVFRKEIPEAGDNLLLAAAPTPLGEGH